MLENIYDNLSSRLCGAPVGVCGDNAEEIISALSAHCGIKLKELSEECGAVICSGDREDTVQLAAGRPCVVISREDCSEKYGCACVPPEEWNENTVSNLFAALLGEFSLVLISVDIPDWMRFLPKGNSAIAELLGNISRVVAGVSKQKQASQLSAVTENCTYWTEEVALTADFGTGRAHLACTARDGIFFGMLSEIAGEKIDGECTLMKYVAAASEAKRGYEKVRDALERARVNGYGIVSPSDADVTYERPERIRQGGSVGIKLRASAPAYHVIRVDVSGEVTPIMGDAAQSENLVKSMLEGFERDPEQTWNTDVFGKSLRAMVRDGLEAKVAAIQEDTRSKLRRAVTRMVNEGKGGVICIIL